MQNLEILTRKHFPFQTFNPGQETAILAVVEAVLEGKRHIIIEAPTGVGKTAIATTVHKVLHELKRGGWRTTLTTTTKGLQDQYRDSDEDIFDLKGKSNYGCPYGNAPYNSANCRAFCAKGKCNSKVECEYVIRRNHWCNDASLRLTNTAFQIEACPMICMYPENRANMIVLDECHRLQHELITHSCIRIAPEEFIYTKTAFPNATNGLRKFVGLFYNHGVGAAKYPTNEMKSEALALAGFFGNIQKVIANRIRDNFNELKEEELVRYNGCIEELQQITDKLNVFGNAFGEWILTEYGKGRMELKPVFAKQVAHTGIFRKAEFFLHMSATICGVEEYAASMGLKDYVYIPIENPIPVENRKVEIAPVMKVSGNYNPKILTNEIDRLFEKHKGQNGIIHTVSFKLAQEIRDASRYKKHMLVSGDREEILDFLSRPDAKGVVLSPSIEHGYDLKGDMCRWAVIAKTPYLYIGDPFVALNMNRSQEWYSREAILRMVQACGRGVRGVDDWCSTYILDSNAIPLINKNIRLFPEWWLDSIECL